MTKYFKNNDIWLIRSVEGGYFVVHGGENAQQTHAFAVCFVPVHDKQIHCCAFFVCHALFKKHMANKLFAARLI
jgi:hypothetical protein